MDEPTPIENHLRDIAVVDLYGFLSGFDENLTRRVVKYQRSGRFYLFSIVCIESNSNVIEGYTLGCCRFREEQHGVQRSKSNHDGFGHVLVLEWHFLNSVRFIVFSFASVCGQWPSLICTISGEAKGFSGEPHRRVFPEGHLQRRSLHFRLS